MLNGIYQAFQHWGEQTVWIYSDPHFGDKDLDNGICDRPSTEEQIASINACIGRKDTLIILGDIGDIDAVRKLRAGRKILIMGNHDAGRTNYERKFASEVFESKEIAMEEMTKKYPGWSINVCLGKAGWIAHAENHLFDEIYEGALLIGEKLILSHEPIKGISWAMNIHGHVHDKRHKNDKYHFNVCSDVIEYKPINFNQWLKQGYLAKIETIHRETIDKATERKKKRGGKKIGK